VENLGFDYEAFENAGWVRRSTRLRFHLGEYRLAVWNIHCLSLGTHYTQLPDNPSETPIPKPPPGIQAVLLPSHPATRDEPRLKRSGKMIRYVPAQVPRYHVDITGTFEDYVKRFSPKSRQTLQRKVKKLTEHSGGTLDFREYTKPEEVEEFYTLAQQISRNTYQARLLQAGLPEGPEFLEEAQQRARQGHFYGYLLMHDNRPISYAYCPATEHGLVYDNLGYDTEYQNWSPGTVLLYLLLERQFRAQKYPLLDFGTGEAQYKDFFSTGVTRCANVYYFRPTLKNIVLVLTHSSLHYLNSAAVKLLQKLNLKARLKKALRERASHVKREVPPPVAT